MIVIYSNKNKLVCGNSYYFNDCEKFFRGMVHSREFKNDDIEAMKIIDNAELKDKNNGSILTPFGEASINDLSTGCKVVLTYLYIQRHSDFYNGTVLLDVTECGYNALDVLFDMMEVYNSVETVLLLRHYNGIYKCKEHDYMYDGKSCRRLY